MGMEHAFDTSFSQTMNTPTMMATAPLTPSTTSSIPTTIKMEDLQVPFDTPSPHDSYPAMSEASSTPAPSGTESRQVKKRKSWGQVLPEPKTTLPPRKRAKTADEKEQRRIERVKRNRLAAHNSRERKRQEYELLQAEKDQMEADLKSYQHKMAQMKSELEFYRTKYPGEAPEPVFDLTTTSSTDAVDTVCPARTSVSFPSPISMDSMDSPRDSSCQPETPASTFEATPDFDSTQYPAAVLCDLQFDEKPVVLDNLFDFSQFPEGSPSAACMEPTTGLADPSSVDFFGSALFGHSSSSTSYGFPDGFDAKFSDLQSASGATFVSDEALAAEL
ncbi:uncharacterized protein K460DRAFT_420370 [Cucurbitaria berberidis CBS 394.84]|uniref:BZIP domain-containing protein n=1 Tax=Cucurbitaria berberidis CBS 394.84 TaxID=1168544 RepID=A0A9P4GAZ8_9PLEO|nr:uncharacterized protein K460DRAFT_420370 [Cucurbitaria berberidis CBS 394.84]KAF1842463.1 hypothetical protein K460DRAFT_420370 [Cucurbitaria berberidis CBS 394.84]